MGWKCPFRKKLNKLKREPLLFFKDSKLIKFFLAEKESKKNKKVVAKSPLEPAVSW